MHQIEELDKDPLLAARRMLLLHSLFYITPGILQIFMGDEYFSSLPFSRQPEELDRNLAGDYHNGVWSTQGSQDIATAMLVPFIPTISCPNDFTALNAYSI